jgi:general secretion pathway protein A
MAEGIRSGLARRVLLPRPSESAFSDKETPMYQAYWGLQRSPFTSAASREALIESPIHAEALARLDFLRESSSPFGLLLGPRGSGKSAVLSQFAQRAARSGALVAACGATAADDLHLLTTLAIGLKTTADGDVSQLWRRVADRLEELRLEGLTAVVLLDDLDRATASTLLLAERLLALPDAPLTIVAAAGRETAGRIGPRLLDQVALRIDLVPWSETETRDYVETRLAQAGRVQEAFNSAATRRLFELSGGAPRRVNQLAQLALLAGAAQQLIQIDADTIDAVQEELSVAR